MIQVQFYIDTPQDITDSQLIEWLEYELGYRSGMDMDNPMCGKQIEAKVMDVTPITENGANLEQQELNYVKKLTDTVANLLMADDEKSILLYQNQLQRPEQLLNSGTDRNEPELRREKSSNHLRAIR